MSINKPCKLLIIYYGDINTPSIRDNISNGNALKQYGINPNHYSSFKEYQCPEERYCDLTSGFDNEDYRLKSEMCKKCLKKIEEYKTSGWQIRYLGQWS